jgi:hypothetical protein
VSLVLLSPENERDECCGFIGRDIVFLMKSHLCDTATHGRGKLAVPASVLLIMAPAKKATKLVDYHEPYLPIPKLNQAQYEFSCRKGML